MARSVSATSSRGTENDSSATPCTTFWMIVSTLTLCGRHELEHRRREPGRSGMPDSVKMTSVSRVCHRR